ncbi:hypothetical protein, partial [uncultured Pseudomonas sp.]|uniref:hypothetical protein n=1 Tax=uncultured Pseudomonas sp. TaxID=114707 RepID=UPI0027DC182D
LAQDCKSILRHQTHSPTTGQVSAAWVHCADFVIGFNGKDQSQTFPDVQSSAIAHPPTVLAQWQMTSHLPNQ